MSIDLVKENLPEWRVEVANWDDAKITAMLDVLGGSMPRTVRQFWLQRLSDAAGLTDTPDRPLSQTFQHAQEMFSLWDRLATNRSRVVKIKRRYPKPSGVLTLSEHRDVYTRVD